MDLPVQNSAVMPASNVDPAPPIPTAALRENGLKKPPKLLYIIGGLAVILTTLALALSFFGKGQVTAPGNPNANSSDQATAIVGWVKYSNPHYFYEISLPPKWLETKLAPDFTDTTIFDAEGVASLKITGGKDITSLDDYLSGKDAATNSGVKSTKSSQVKVGEYDGIERAESWSNVGLQVLSTYVQIKDMFYTFTLIPTGNKSAITNESLIRDYHTALSSFRITDPSQLGVDLKDYLSQPVAGLAFNAFSLKYPQTWVAKETIGDNNLELSIYRNNYELTISQKAVGGAVCLFSDSPPFEGSSGDLRNKQYSEFNTTGGLILRRYFNDNQGDKSTMFFCEKQTDGPYFQTPLRIGGLVYNVPAKYDPDIIKEMDEIVKSISITESPTP